MADSRRSPGTAAGPRPAYGDLAFAAAVIAAAALVWIGTADLPPPRYEPIGSAALPRAIALIMALLALVVATKALRGGRGGRGTGAERAPATAIARAVVLAAVVFLFVAVMDARLVGFRPAAIVFLTATCVILGGFGWRRLAAFAVFSAVLTIGLHAVFTRFFYIDLP